MKEETAVEEEFKVKMREEIAVKVMKMREEVSEEIVVEIKDGEFGVLADEEVGERHPTEYPQKEAKGLKVISKGNPGKKLESLKDNRKQDQDIENITENGPKYSQQEMQFKCKQCDKTFTIKRELVRHRKIVHEGKIRMFKIREIQNL